MKIAIIGSGAVGGYFGAKLVKTGFQVSFLARGQQLQAIKTHGLRIKSILGDFEVPTPKASDSIKELGPSDLILLSVKAWQVKEVSTQLLDIVHPQSLVLPLQNGVLAADELASDIDESQVLGGVCRIISKIESPGVINHFGATPSIVFGSLKNTAPGKLDQVKEVLDQAGIHCKLSPDIRAEIWRKFGFICTGGLMAVARSPLGEIRQLDETRAMMVDLILEICALADTMAIDMETDFLPKTMGFIDNLPPETTFSMARDIWDGNPSELDYLNGAVVQLATKHQVEVPINKFVYNILKPLELKARNRS